MTPEALKKDNHLNCLLCDVMGWKTLWESAKMPLWRIYETVILNVTYHICVATSHSSFSKVKRSGTKLITDQWIFTNGNERKPFAVGNPFLIEFMHLVSFWECTIILLPRRKPCFCAHFQIFALSRFSINVWKTLIYRRDVTIYHKESTYEHPHVSDRYIFLSRGTKFTSFPTWWGQNRLWKETKSPLFNNSIMPSDI